MSLIRRLRLDDVVTSFPELGPTVPDGGYSWVILFGIFLIQMTVPSVLSMYGIVFGHLAEVNSASFYIWNEKLILTPILFTAFWSLADPWTKTIVSMATIPRLVGMIGVALLSIGAIASGYLATGGVGAYLARSSAGAVMGIGASFVILQSDHILRKYFRRRLLLALTLKNIGSSFGLVLVPGLTYFLLNETGLKTGLLLMTIIFLPTALGTITFRAPVPQERSHYRLLLSAEEDTEIPVRISPDNSQNNQDQDEYDGLENLMYGQTEERREGDALFSEANNIYAYQEPGEDVDLFVNPVAHSNSKWKQQLRVFKLFRFWAALIGWVGMKTAAMFFWTFLPTLYITIATSAHSGSWMMLSVIAGFGTLLANVASYKMLSVKSDCRRVHFGLFSLLGSVVLICMTFSTSYTWMATCALLGGISTGSLSSCQDLALYDILGAEVARRAQKGFFTLAGFCLLIFCFIHGVNICLRLAAILQLLGGLYWLSTPALDLVKAKKYGLFHTTNRTNTSQT